MMKSTRENIFFIVFGMLLCFCGCQREQKEDNKKIAEEENELKFKNNRADEKDAQYVVEVIACNLAEIKMAELGEQKASALEVKEIATMLKTQHTDIVNKFKSYAALKEISLPNDVTPDDKREEDEVIDKTDFDKAWCEDIKKLHGESIRKFEDASTQVHDPELRELASESLPMARMHYDKILAVKIK